MSDDEMEKFEITDYDIENEFSMYRKRKGNSKHQQIYGQMVYTTLSIEPEVEINRENRNWNKVIELATALNEKTSSYNYVTQFLISEGQLEKYLEDFPPVKANENKAKLQLMDAMECFQSIINSDLHGKMADIVCDALLLLAKLNYTCGYYSEALQNLQIIDLENLAQQKLSLRKSKILCDSIFIKAMCIEFNNKNNIDEILKYFMLASDLALYYIQQCDESKNATNIHKNICYILEQVLLKTPLLLIEKKNYLEALSRYRALLGAVENQTIKSTRLKLLWQFAEFLLLGYLNETYIPPLMIEPFQQIYNNKNLFIPKFEYEEILLVLLLAESTAVSNAVLSQTDEFKQARLSSYHNICIVYDLLTLATVRWAQFSLLQESIGRAMKFSFKEPHLWRQYALSLIASEKYDHGLDVLKEIIRLEKFNSINNILAAKLCYEHLNNAEQGVEFSVEALKMEMLYSNGLLGRCYLYMGIGYHLKAKETFLYKDKAEFNNKALEYFKTADEIDNNDYLSKHYLSLHLSVMGKVKEALEIIKEAITLQPDNSSSFQLLALLLSAVQRHQEALLVVEAILDEYPDNLNLLHLKACLELHQIGGETALITAKYMLSTWKKIYDNLEISLDCASTLDSLCVQNITEILSEESSCFSKNNSTTKSSHLILLDIWLLLAELYLAVNKPKNVIKCIEEASQIAPLSHQMLYIKGLFHIYKHEWSDAKLCLQKSLAINPLHVKSLQELGMVYHHLNLQGLAEASLKEAAKIEPNNYITWYNLGKVCMHPATMKQLSYPWRQL